MVLLQTTPSTGDIVGAVSWHRDGPTADLNDIRIVWEADRLEQVRADAEHPTVYAESDVPAETERTVIDEDEGWMAVVPSDWVITNPVERCRDAEYRGHEILGPVELPLADADESDLVEVDADPTLILNRGMPTTDLETKPPEAPRASRSPAGDATDGEREIL